jgi:hypothetical protein
MNTVNPGNYKENLSNFKEKNYTELHRGFTELQRVEFSVALCGPPDFLCVSS